MRLLELKRWLVKKSLDFHWKNSTPVAVLLLLVTPWQLLEQELVVMLFTSCSKMVKNLEL